MVETHEWEKLLTIINEGKRFILTTHFNPDGDALGSEIALANFLQQKNKQVWILNNSQTIYNYRFLDPDDKILVFDSKKHADLVMQSDVVIILDISDWERLDELGNLINKSPAQKVCIDHHHVESKFAQMDIIYEQASSTGELIYEFLNYANCEMNNVIAEALYTCILTDTGSFRFSNTTAQTHRIAADLIGMGVNARAIYEKVYESNSRTKMELMGKALANLRYEYDGKFAWFILDQQVFKETKADIADTEGFTEIPRTIDGVEVSMMVTELKPGKVKISLRSKGRVIINEVAMKLGGGGHNFAAGAVLDKSLERALPLVLNEVKNVMSKYC